MGEHHFHEQESAPLASNDDLYQLSKGELVEMIKALQAERARLKEKLNLDSQTSSQSPSQDLIKKSEKKKSTLEAEETKMKRKPGGQPGHQGKTRKGFGRVDKIAPLSPQLRPHCGGTHLTTDSQKVEIQQVAQLVAHPIEIVEYHRHHYQRRRCGHLALPTGQMRSFLGKTWELGFKR